MWKSFGFEVPLFDGGLVNYPEWFLEDMTVLNWLNRLVRHQMGFDD